MEEDFDFDEILKESEELDEAYAEVDEWEELYEVDELTEWTDFNDEEMFEPTEYL